MPQTNNYYLINKPTGETPLQTLLNLRREKGIDKSVSMTYAGRLDPMAEGLLLILVGDECKNKDKYLGLDKEYEVEVLLGIGSDTGDVLGIIELRDEFKEFRFKNSKIKQNEISHQVSSEVIYDENIIERIKLLIGKRSEKYPSFSSKTINGKPLFMHAKEGSLEEVDIPEKEIEIYSINFIESKIMDSGDILSNVIERILKVKGEFRQKEIIESWRNLLAPLNVKESLRQNLNNIIGYRQNDKLNMQINHKFQIIKLQVKSSTGTYMRTLAIKLGELLNTKALAWSIKRKKIGDYSI